MEHEVLRTSSQDLKQMEFEALAPSGILDPPKEQPPRFTSANSPVYNKPTAPDSNTTP